MLYGSCSRLDDIISLRRKHIRIEVGFVKLTLPRSKTDQIRDSREKFLAVCTDFSLCPVVNLRQWLARKELGHSPEAALFPARWALERAIAKTTYRDNLKAALKDVQLPAITSHSWRVAPASGALEHGCNVEDMQHFVCWAVPKSMQPYIMKTQNRKIKMAGLVWPD